MFKPSPGVEKNAISAQIFQRKAWLTEVPVAGFYRRATSAILMLAPSNWHEASNATDRRHVGQSTVQLLTPSPARAATIQNCAPQVQRKDRLYGLIGTTILPGRVGVSLARRLIQDGPIQTELASDREGLASCNVHDHPGMASIARICSFVSRSGYCARTSNTRAPRP